MLEAVLEGALRGLEGRLQDAALDVVQPPVVAATEPALLDAAVLQRGAAVTTAEEHQPWASLAIAESDEVLAQEADPFRKILQVRGAAHRDPLRRAATPLLAPGVPL